MSTEERISPEELDDIARDLADTEELWAAAQRETTTNVTCDECGGAGNVDRGTLGSGCWKCHGVGYIPDQFSDKKPLELPDDLRTMRLEYKKVRGLLDAHQMGTVAAANAEEAGIEAPPIPPAPTRGQAMTLLEAVAKLDGIREDAKKVVRAHRAENTAGQLGSGEESAASLRKRLKKAEERERRALGGGGSLGGGLGDVADDAE